jgi:hypothetical protein
MPFYDALYAWCRDKASAETHSWKPETMTGVAAMTPPAGKTGT